MSSRMARNTRWLLSAAMALAVTGCASSPPQPATVSNSWPDESDRRPAAPITNEDASNYVRAREKAMAQEYALLQDRQLREAYEQGARDTLEDFKGRMRARAGFVWEPPLVEWVDMPAQQINGAIYPAHKAPVIIRPGRWVEENGVALPDLEARR